MPAKIGLIGSEGKLGKVISSLYPTIPIHRTTERKTVNCDVVIDVSSPEALEENLLVEKPLVIGTTGHLNFSLIEKRAQEIPILYAPNFSLGIVLMNRLASQIAKYFPSDIDLIETHHAQKKDSPSGTALMLAKNLPKVHIHSLRSGQITGEHTLIFNNAEEKITLTHTAHTRNAFAKGAIAAALFLLNQPAGLYTMDHLMLD